MQLIRDNPNILVAHSGTKNKGPSSGVVAFMILGESSLVSFLMQFLFVRIVFHTCQHMDRLMN